MSEDQSRFNTPEQQKMISKQMLESKKTEVGSWIPGRRNLRLNLDALQADRRQNQIKATLESAKDADAYTMGLKETERQQTEFILRSNTLRLLEQINSTNHTAGAVDRFVKKLFSREKQKSEQTITNDVAVRREVAEYFRNDPEAVALYGKDGLGSDKIADADKAVLLRNLQELFKALGRNANSAELRQQFENLRAEIVRNIASALPKLSAELQELAMLSMGDLGSFGSYESEVMTSTPDTFSQAHFLESLTPTVFASLDEEAKIQFLKKVKLNAHTAHQVIGLLRKEKNKAVLEAAMKAIGDADSAYGPDGSIVVAVGHGAKKWSDLTSNERSNQLDYYNKTALEEALLLPIDRSTGYAALQALDAYAGKTFASGGLPEAFEKAADLFDEFRPVDTVDLSYFAAAPGYYLEKYRREKANYEKTKIKDDLTSIVRTTWRKLESLVESNLSSNVDRIEALTTALESGKQALGQMESKRSFRQEVGGYSQNGVIRKLESQDRRMRGIAARLSKVFSE